MKRLITFLLIGIGFACYFCQPLSAQLSSSDSLRIDTSGQVFVTIRAIKVHGNKHTRTNIILRELEFHAGDTLHLTTLAARMEHNRLRVLNLNLFSSAKMNISDWTHPDSITLDITVRESWYIWPAPIFEIADRSFNVWYVEQNHDLRRTNYGLFFIHTNATGRNDRFRFTIQSGYTQKYEIDYSRPFLNKKQTLGGSINVYYGNNKEVAYRTLGNKPQFFKDTSTLLLIQRRSSAGITYQPKLYSRHEWRVFYFDRSTDSATVLKRNPDYFLDNRKRQRFVSFLYRYTLDRRDNTTYPSSGYYIGGSILKDGFWMPWEDRNSLEIDLHIARFYSLTPKSALAADIWVGTNLVRQKQAYYQYRGLGVSGRVPHGYEYFVVEGMDFAMFRTNARYELFDRVYKFDYKLLPKFLREIAIKLNLSMNADAAYVNDPYYAKGNPLNNKWLLGSGIGIDVLLFHNALIRYEFNANQLGQTYFYLNSRFFF